MADLSASSHKNTDWKEVFRTHSISQTIQLEKFIQQQVEEKSRELQQNVCLNYQSFLKAADSISQIQSSLLTVVNDVHQLQSHTNERKVVAAADVFSKLSSLEISDNEACLRRFVKRFCHTVLPYTFQLLHDKEYLLSVRLFLFCDVLIQRIPKGDKDLSKLIHKYDACIHYYVELLSQLSKTDSLNQDKIIASFTLLKNFSLEDALNAFLDVRFAIVMSMTDTLQFCLEFVNTSILVKNMFPNHINQIISSIREHTFLSSKSLRKDLCLTDDLCTRYLLPQDLNFVPQWDTSFDVDLTKVLEQWRNRVYSHAENIKKPFFQEDIDLDNLKSMYDSLSKSTPVTQMDDLQDLWKSLLCPHFVNSLQKVINDLEYHNSKVSVLIEVILTSSPQFEHDVWNLAGELNLSSFQSYFLQACGMKDDIQSFHQQLSSFNSSVKRIVYSLESFDSYENTLLPFSTTNLKSILYNKVQDLSEDIIRKLEKISEEILFSKSIENKDFLLAKAIKLVRLIGLCDAIPNFTSFDSFREKIINALAEEIVNKSLEGYPTSFNEELRTLDGDSSENTFLPLRATYTVLMNTVDRLESIGIDIATETLKKRLVSTLSVSMLNVFKDISFLSLSNVQKQKVIFDYELMKHLYNKCGNEVQVEESSVVFELQSEENKEDTSLIDIGAISTEAENYVMRIRSFFTILFPNRF
ncbi:transport complex subunit Cog1 [Schizosaccharomyces cryophilus OY26]|uniref:Conserved oligomeric Golgi complex subunit 1 n=1 Tax=Schizosaccharomyces cryophilus (strain OY26 / ATCC MYA-4695 / CBS 11777 / NBRC 106824 / NRRL Y48691) TaxID=653667 RepID=S9VVU9_SCHCR|nr:transport complex subunit Cog1 [Schizosaccharomyces cryophilus OY26]EPY50305.1 transport complex subunit Cog1 [Schizosaccharomyces cryophilus OY26]